MRSLPRTRTYTRLTDAGNRVSIGSLFTPLCVMCIADERAGFFAHTDCLVKPLGNAPLFSDFSKWRTTLETTYRGTFADLVFGEMPDMNEIAEVLVFLHKNIRA